MKLASALAVLLGACGGPPVPCDGSDHAHTAQMAACDVRIMQECRGVPAAECQAVADCKAMVKARCAP